MSLGMANGRMMPLAAQNANNEKAMDESEVGLGYNGGVV